MSKRVRRRRVHRRGRRRRRRRGPATLLALGAWLVLLVAGAVAWAPAASAHATVVSATPADQARLQTAPRTVSITFDEPVTITYLTVIDQAGRQVQSGAAFHPRGDGAVIAVALRAGLPDGTYVESFRIISADTHPITGVVRFVVGNGPLVSGGPASVASADPVSATLLGAARDVSYAGLIGLGGLWLVVTVWPAGRDDTRARRILWTGWAAALVGALAELLLQGPYAAGVGPQHLFDLSLLSGTMHLDTGHWHGLRVVLLGVLALLLGGTLRTLATDDRHGDDTRVELLVLAAGLAFTFSAVGHPSTTSPAWLSIGLDMAHLLAVSVWLGGLLMLVVAIMPRREPQEVTTSARAVSRVALVSVAVIAGSGLYAAWRGVGTLGALVSTQYGLLVLGKVALFAVILAVASISRRSVLRGHGERLRRGVLAELGVAAVVLVLTTVLVASPRGLEALQTRARHPITAGAVVETGRYAEVTLSSGVHGTVGLTVTLPAGVRAQSVTATATQPEQRIGPIPVPLSRTGPSRYSASGLALPVAGRWVIVLVITESEFESVTTQASFTLI